MAHPHSHTPAQAPDNSNARRLLWAFIVTAGFMLIEAIGGAISGSLALLADAGHMLTDSAALLFALLAVRLAPPPPHTPPRQYSLFPPQGTPTHPPMFSLRSPGYC
ncbi:cation transporter, partial [Klebsiella quasivariicola]|uniref:cation transporter n=1 Tax=Klebsiella quasivariicola TaxID=2026240 RepID=UPI002021E7E5